MSPLSPPVTGHQLPPNWPLLWWAIQQQQQQKAALEMGLGPGAQPPPMVPPPPGSSLFPQAAATPPWQLRQMALNAMTIHRLGMFLQHQQQAGAVPNGLASPIQPVPPMMPGVGGPVGGGATTPSGASGGRLSPDELSPSSSSGGGIFGSLPGGELFSCLKCSKIAGQGYYRAPTYRRFKLG